MKLIILVAVVVLWVSVQSQKQNCFCSLEYFVVCGSDGITYANPCLAKCGGAKEIRFGKCSSVLQLAPSRFTTTKRPYTTNSKPSFTKPTRPQYTTPDKPSRATPDKPSRPTRSSTTKRVFTRPTKPGFKRPTTSKKPLSSTRRQFPTRKQF